MIIFHTCLTIDTFQILSTHFSNPRSVYVNEEVLIEKPIKDTLTKTTEPHNEIKGDNQAFQPVSLKKA